ncbi:hypothetical protein SKAU_G00199220 [Synaphobranchus kaupii]|uniref:Uncharacterized protein n=1 Tax=Synaphobranchus kaupii TaxID=118154 RepID=A0A9Q1IY11_SYNKA|nr:hypothetical protein SKAU_G00199220 [Synaphobranchus kaupii]
MGVKVKILVAPPIPEIARRRPRGTYQSRPAGTASAFKPVMKTRRRVARRLSCPADRAWRFLPSAFIAASPGVPRSSAAGRPNYPEQTGFRRAGAGLRASAPDSEGPPRNGVRA